MSKLISVDEATDSEYAKIVKICGIRRPGNKGGPPDVVTKITSIIDVNEKQKLELCVRPMIIKYQDSVRRGDAMAAEWQLAEKTLFASAFAERGSLLSKEDRTKRDFGTLPILTQLAIVKSTFGEDSAAFKSACKLKNVDPSSVE